MDYLNKRAIVLFLTTLIVIQPSLAATDCGNYPSSAMLKLKKLGATISVKPQSDYVKLHTSTTCYLEAWPKNTDETAALVKTAYQFHIPIRTQGGSHSFNGSSLPQFDELLIHTNAMNQITINSANDITAGSGTAVLLINKLLYQYNLQIPIENSGTTIGPTIGGYLSAGGVSPNSPRFGGLWDNVNQITLVTGFGEIKRIKNSDAIFNWLFGSMGQLGVITEVSLRTIPLDPANNNAAKIPIGKSITASFSDNGGTYHASNTIVPLNWVVLFVSPQQSNEAISDLNNLMLKYPDAMIWQPLIAYQINTHNPPRLIYKKGESFFLVTIWGNKNNSEKGRSAFNALIHDYTNLVLEKKYHRYIQTEYTDGTQVYRDYFSPETYNEFRKIKRQLDPKMLFNQKSFFPQQDKPQQKTN